MPNPRGGLADSDRKDETAYSRCAARRRRVGRTPLRRAACAPLAGLRFLVGSSMKKLNKKQAARENGAKGGRKARAEPTAEPGGGVAGR